MFYEVMKVQREVARGIHAGLGEVRQGLCTFIGTVGDSIESSG